MPGVSRGANELEWLNGAGMMMNRFGKAILCLGMLILAMLGASAAAEAPSIASISMPRQRIAFPNLFIIIPAPFNHSSSLAPRETPGTQRPYYTKERGRIQATRGRMYVQPGLFSFVIDFIPRIRYAEGGTVKEHR